MILRTNSDAADFLELQELLDAELWLMYPVLMNQYAEHNVLPESTPAVIYYEGSIPAAIGAFKPIPAMEAIEIKRMYVHQDFRSRGLGKVILDELEKCGIELGFRRAILETGTLNHAAHKLYERSGYKRIENYGVFVGLDDSWCYAKQLIL